MKNIKDAISERLTDLLLDKKELLSEQYGRKVTQGEICEEIGINPASFSKYLNGDTEPTASMLLLMARYFQVSTDYILGVDKWSPPIEEERFVSNYTGLSPKSVRTLNYWANTNLIYQNNGKYYRTAVTLCSFFDSIIAGYLGGRDLLVGWWALHQDVIHYDEEGTLKTIIVSDRDKDYRIWQLGENFKKYVNVLFPKIRDEIVHRIHGGELPQIDENVIKEAARIFEYEDHNSTPNFLEIFQK